MINKSIALVAIGSFLLFISTTIYAQLTFNSTVQNISSYIPTAANTTLYNSLEANLMLNYEYKLEPQNPRHILLFSAGGVGRFYFPSNSAGASIEGAEGFEPVNSLEAKTKGLVFDRLYATYINDKSTWKIGKMFFSDDFAKGNSLFMHTAFTQITSVDLGRGLYADPYFEPLTINPLRRPLIATLGVTLIQESTGKEVFKYSLLNFRSSETTFFLSNNAMARKNISAIFEYDNFSFLGNYQLGIWATSKTKVSAEEELMIEPKYRKIPAWGGMYGILTKDFKLSMLENSSITLGTQNGITPGAGWVQYQIAATIIANNLIPSYIIPNKTGVGFSTSGFSHKLKEMYAQKGRESIIEIVNELLYTSYLKSRISFAHIFSPKGIIDTKYSEYKIAANVIQLAVEASW